MVERLVAYIRAAQTESVGPLVVAIDGRSGSGKSTLAAATAPLLDAAVIEVDTFFAGGDDAHWRSRTPRQRNAEVIDWARLRGEALEPLRAGRPARWHPFDYATWECLADTPIVLEPAPVVLVEGAYAAGPWLADRVDLTVLVTLAEDERIRRLHRRQGAEQTARWLSTWKPAEEIYFARDRPAERFDLVLAAAPD